jgi:hypothetical protein
MAEETKPVIKPVKKKKAPKNFLAKKHPNFSSTCQPKNIPGRPPGSHSISDVIRKVFAGMVALKDKDGNVINITKEELCVLKVVERIITKGDAVAFDKIIDRVEGKAQQNISLSGNVSVPVVSSDEMIKIIEERKHGFKKTDTE